MAIAAFQYYTSTASVREDLISDITNISPTDTPFTSRIGKTKATQRTHEWLTDALETRSDGGTRSVDGAAYASSRRSARSRLANYTEILVKSWTVSESVEAMDTVSEGKREFRYQSGLRMKELANGMEFNLVGSTSTGVSGASATASEAKALTSWIATNYNSATANRTLTLAMVDDTCQSIWTEGGTADIIMLGAARKRNLSNIYSSSSYGTRETPSKGGILEQRVDSYHGEIGGVLEVVLSRDADANTIFILELAKWKLAWLRRPHLQVMGKEGDRKSAQWVAEYTMESRNEKASGKVGQLTG